MVQQSLADYAYEVLKAYWHYNDEGKAYTEETYIPFMKQFTWLKKTITSEEKKQLETDESIQEVLTKLEKLEKELVAVGDPQKLRVPIWNAGNVPDMKKNPDYQVVCDDPFKNESLDPESYIPSFVPYFLEDGEKHPVILVLGGGDRSNYSCGDQMCRYLNEHGFHAALMGHRVGIQKLNYSMDLQRTVRYLRYHAETYRIEKEHIGAIGFSFGGVVITSYIEKMNYADQPSKYDPSYQDDEIDKESGALNAVLGIYTSASPFLPRPEQIDYTQYPPVFMALGNEDYGFSFQSKWVDELVQHGVAMEVHAFDGGIHGFGMGDSSVVLNGKDEHIPAIAMWPSLAIYWLKRVFAGNKET